MEPSGRCVRQHTVAERAESYIIFTRKHVAIFSYKGNNSVTANAVYRVFWYIGLGSYKIFSPVAEKHVNNTTQQLKNHGILIVPFIATDLFLQSKFRVLDVYTAFTNQQRWLYKSIFRPIGFKVIFF